MRSIRRLATLVVASAITGSALAAQTPAGDPSARLREVLPANVADRVIARIAEARARELPAQALENRALKFAAKGVAPAEIERSVAEQAERMNKAKGELHAGRARTPSGDEIEAGAEALRQGVDGKSVSALAKLAPSGRSLAVPLYVLGSLVNRGLPSDEALAIVAERLASRASDAELEKLPAQAAGGQSNRPALTGRDLAATRSGNAGGGPPAGIPANGGKSARPAGVGKPDRPGKP